MSLSSFEERLTFYLIFVSLAKKQDYVIWKEGRAVARARRASDGAAT